MRNNLDGVYVFNSCWHHCGLYMVTSTNKFCRSHLFQQKFENLKNSYRIQTPKLTHNKWAKKNSVVQSICQNIKKNSKKKQINQLETVSPQKTKQFVRWRVFSIHSQRETKLSQNVRQLKRNPSQINIQQWHIVSLSNMKLTEMTTFISRHCSRHNMPTGN